MLHVGRFPGVAAAVPVTAVTQADAVKYHDPTTWPVTWTAADIERVV
jgi:hypothetical protein